MRACDNPFAVDKVLQIRYRLKDEQWEELFRLLARLKYRAAIVGPQGSGKTTLLEDLAPRLEKLGFTVKNLRLHAQERYFPRPLIKNFWHNLQATDIILLDGAEQMNFVRWQIFRTRCKRAAGLIITTHRFGMLPTLWQCQTNIALLSQIIQTLLPTNSSISDSLVISLFEKYQGNIRDALREMYDIYAAK